MDKTIRISIDLYNKIKACAKEEKRTLKTIFEITLVRYLQEKILKK